MFEGFIDPNTSLIFKTFNKPSRNPSTLKVFWQNSKPSDPPEGFAQNLQTFMIINYPRSALPASGRLSPIPAAASVQSTLCEWTAACRKDHAPHRPKKLKWGLPSTCLTFPVSLRHNLRDFNWVWSALSWPTFSSHHQNEVAEKCRQNPLYICRFSESMRGIWWQSPSAFFNRWRPVETYLNLSQLYVPYMEVNIINTWRVLLCKIRSDFWTTKPSKPSQNLHKTFNEGLKVWSFWRFENKE